MAIILNTDNTDFEAVYNIYPDQFVSKKEKESPKWIKQNLDYFYNIALNQYVQNKELFGHNYNYVKGILRKEDFYLDETTEDFLNTLTSEVELPSRIQQYSIMNTPINMLCGEMTKRPHNIIVKAFDDDSKSEELLYRTEILNQYITAKVQRRLLEQAVLNGVDVENMEEIERIQEIADEQLTELLTSFTSQAEKWANKVLSALKVEFNLKEKSEEAFKDLLISARPRFHIYPDNSTTGFNIETLNPVNVWKLMSPNKKYLKEAYASGIIEVKELSEIIDRYPFLTKQEIDHLRNKSQIGSTLDSTESNLFSGKVGVDSISYSTYDPLRLQERLMVESDMMYSNGPDNSLDVLFGLNSSSTGAFGLKYVVLTAYWISKKKVGELTFINDDGIEEVLLVDENYKNKSHPRQVSLEWGYINEWMVGYKIDDIYHAEPLRILPYNPIIGVDYDNKNSQVKSIVDLLKPFQALIDISGNQLWDILSKDKGMQLQMPIRQIPKAKDGTYESAIEIAEAEMINRGMIFTDDSPENMKVVGGNTNVARPIDLSRHNEIMSRYNLMQILKHEAWELIGINKQRAGNILATETATAVNTATNASYAQTEPLFIQHEYLLNQLYQAILDAAQYIQANEPTSSISTIGNEGENSFIEVTGSEISLKDLRVFLTSQAEDLRELQEMKNLSQAMLQNGADPYTISLLYSSNSIRQHQQALKIIKETEDKFRAEQQRLEQEKIQASLQQTQMQIQAAQIQDEKNKSFEALQKELDRINKKEVAAINSAKFNQEVLNDINNNGLADSLELSTLAAEREAVNKKYSLEQQRITSQLVQNQQKAKQEDKKHSDLMKLEKEKIDLEKEKLKVENKKIDSQYKIAKENKNRYDFK